MPKFKDVTFVVKEICIYKYKDIKWNKNMSESKKIKIDYTNITFDISIINSDIANDYGYTL